MSSNDESNDSNFNSNLDPLLQNNKNPNENNDSNGIDSPLYENIKMDKEKNIIINDKTDDKSNSIKIKENNLENKEEEKENEQNDIIINTKKNIPRKSLNTPFMEKFMNKILSLDEDDKSKLKKKYNDDDFFLLGIKNKKKKKEKKNKETMENIINEESSYNINSSLLQQKKKTIIKGILDLNRENEWNEFIEEYQKKNEEKKFTKKLKSLFNINSDFMVIWKKSFSVFYMVILYMFFFKYVFLELPNLNEGEMPKKRILYLYKIINIMFTFDLVLTIIVIINNGGSLITFLKLPLKFYMIIPFALKTKNIPYLMPKFCRIDLFKRVFDSIEQFIVVNITHNIQNYHLRNFIIYTNRMFSYLLEFGLYAHFTCCIFSYFDKIKYISALYYTIETFTTIGFGEISPNSEKSLLVGILNLYIGINLFTIMTCNVNYLTTKLYAFSREMSLKQQLEFLIFKMQNSTGKVFPFHLKQLIHFFILFRRGLSYKDIQTQYEPTLKVCRNKMIKNIRKSLLSFLRKEYYLCFSKCEKQFINSLLEVVKPKIFKTNKIIVDYGQKVKYLYFLINGELFAYNKEGKPIFSIFNSAIFCEYEFITGTTSDFIIKVHPKIPAYGFVITKEDWDIISEKYLNSVEKFIDLAYKKRKIHLGWLDKSYKNKLNFEINNEKIENINDIFEEDGKIKLEENSKLKKENINNDRILPIKNKSDKYNVDNLKIIKKIKNLNKEIQFLELSLIEYKEKAYEFISK